MLISSFYYIDHEWKRKTKNNNKEEIAFHFQNIEICRHWFRSWGIDSFNMVVSVNFSSDGSFASEAFGNLLLCFSLCCNCGTSWGLDSLVFCRREWFRLLKSERMQSIFAEAWTPASRDQGGLYTKN